MSQSYVNQALVTLSNGRFHSEKVSMNLFHVSLFEAVEALKKLDAVKKSLFYGKILPENMAVSSEFMRKYGEPENCQKVLEGFEHDKQGEHLIHAILGIATEAGELLEALYKTTIEGEEFDFVNAGEEMGDVFWYMAVLAYATGVSFEKAQQTNIEKLRERYGEKFSEFDALNRDLKKERKILEKGVDKQQDLF